MAIKAADRAARRSTLSVRLTPARRAELEQAASENGRSLTQEVEMRLEKSFYEDDLVYSLFGGNRHSRNLVEGIATVIRRIEMVRDSRWVEDYSTLWACRKAIGHVLEMTMGLDHGDPDTPDPDEDSSETVKKLSGTAFSAAMATGRDLGIIAPGPEKSSFMHLVKTRLGNVEKDKSK